MTHFPIMHRAVLLVVSAFLGIADTAAAAEGILSPRSPELAQISTSAPQAEWTNSLGMRFVPVPGTGVHFSIWLTRVKDFEAFVQETGHDATQGMLSLQNDHWVQLGGSWRNPGFSQTPDHPVCGVNWEDAQAFCAWLSMKEGRTYRLPTDLEWSAAAGLGREIGGMPKDRKERVIDLFPWGVQWPPPQGAGNFADASGKARYPDLAAIDGYSDGFAETSPVGAFARSPSGLYDVAGNLWEWCESWFDESLKQKTLRGGSWYSSLSRSLWTSARFNSAPESRQSRFGFRVVLASEQAGTSKPAAGVLALPNQEPPRVEADTVQAGWTNSLGMRFVPVPGAKVRFSVWLTRVRDFERFTRESGHDATRGMYSLQDNFWVQQGGTWRSPGFPQTPDHPVCGVSWEDARAFCRWLSRKEGKTYRLPADLEWSAAAGLGAEREDTPEGRSGKVPDRFPWGVEWPPPAGAGNFADASAKAWFVDVHVIPGYRDGYPMTSPVGVFAPNSAGLYDMAGNLWEWCEDWFNAKQDNRVLRGGCWYSYYSGGLWSSERFKLPPETRTTRCGFRVVLEDGVQP